MCQIDDSEPWQFVVSKTRRASKNHKCAECGRVIHAGELYEYTAGKIMDGIYSSKTCEHCCVARIWLVNECGGYLYEGVLEDLEEHAHERIGGFELGRLIIAMRRKWQRFTSDDLMAIPSPPRIRRATPPPPPSTEGDHL